MLTAKGDSLNENRGAQLWKRAKKIIPGGGQLLSKRSEMFLPGLWPSYYSRAKGVEVWDLDDNRYIDMSFMGVGACPLGYSDDDVNEAVIKAIKEGSMCTLNTPLEVDLAEVLLELHPWANMARFARCGGEAMAIAVRIARARTRRDFVAFCGYHGWHDWYLASNLARDQNLDGHLLPGLKPIGVPRGLLGTAMPFRYNHIEELESIVAKHGGQLGAIILEPVRDMVPEIGFLERIRELANKTGAMLIFDEVSSGFRLNIGGAHLLYGVEPDVAVFAKAMGNGHPIGAVIGTSDCMQAAQDTFISSTNWTEAVGPAAALATIEKYKKRNVPTHLVDIGNKVQECWKNASEKTGLAVEISGIAPLSHLTFSGRFSQEAATYLTQSMLERGYLAGKSFYPCLAHTSNHVSRFEKELRGIFETIAEGLEKGILSQKLKGGVAHKGFKRLA